MQQQERDEFIVVPAATAGIDGVAALKQLLSELGASRLVLLIGTPDEPRRAIVTLSQDEARALTQRYAGRLLMELNAPLLPSTNSQ